MIYIVLRGTLNPAHSVNHYLIKASEFHCMVSSYCFRSPAIMQTSHSRSCMQNTENCSPAVFGLFCGYTHSWKMKKNKQTRKRQRSQNLPGGGGSEWGCMLLSSDRKIKDNRKSQYSACIREIRSVKIWKLSSYRDQPKKHIPTKTFTSCNFYNRIPQMVNARNTGV